VANLFPAGSFDVVFATTPWRYVDDPVAVLRVPLASMRDSSAILSVIVRNQAGEVLKARYPSRRFGCSGTKPTAQWGHESLYAGKVRLFTAEACKAMLMEASLAVTAKRGLRSCRIICRHEFRSVLSTTDFELELKLGRRPSLPQSPATLNALARCAGPVRRVVHERLHNPSSSATSHVVPLMVYFARLGLTNECNLPVPSLPRSDSRGPSLSGSSKGQFMESCLFRSVNLGTARTACIQILRQCWPTCAHNPSSSPSLPTAQRGCLEDNELRAFTHRVLCRFTQLKPSRMHSAVPATGALIHPAGRALRETGVPVTIIAVMMKRTTCVWRMWRGSQTIRRSLRVNVYSGSAITFMR